MAGVGSGKMEGTFRKKMQRSYTENVQKEDSLDEGQQRRNCRHKKAQEILRAGTEFLASSLPLPPTPLFFFVSFILR